jgi:hypothetical protein
MAGNLTLPELVALINTLKSLEASAQFPAAVGEIHRLTVALMAEIGKRYVEGQGP